MIGIEKDPQVNLRGSGFAKLFKVDVSDDELIHVDCTRTWNRRRYQGQ